MTHRKRLLQISAQLDRLLVDADSILAEPVYADIGMMAEELRELIVNMEAKVDEKRSELDGPRESAFIAVAEGNALKWLFKRITVECPRNASLGMA